MVWMGAKTQGNRLYLFWLSLEKQSVFSNAVQSKEKYEAKDKQEENTPSHSGVGCVSDPQRCCAGAGRGCCVKQDALQQGAVGWESKLVKSLWYFNATSGEGVRDFRIRTQKCIVYV